MVTRQSSDSLSIQSSSQAPQLSVRERWIRQAESVLLEILAERQRKRAVQKAKRGHSHATSGGQPDTGERNGDRLMVSKKEIAVALTELKKYDNAFTHCLNAARQVFSKQNQDHLVL